MTLEDLEVLFPNVNHHIGVPTFLNGGCRPKVVNYDMKVTYTAGMAVGVAEQLCPLLGRTLTVEQLLRYSKWLKSRISTLSTMLQQTKGELPLVGVSIAWLPDGRLIGACSACDETIDLDTGVDLYGMDGVPRASLYISLTSLYLFLKAEMARQTTDKEAVNVAVKEVAECKGDLGESGVLCHNADNASN